MTGFIYALSGVTKKPEVRELQACGLGHAFNAEPYDFVPVRRGPWGDGGGVLVMPSAYRGGSPLGYFEGAQEWREVPEALVLEARARVGVSGEEALPRVFVGRQKGGTILPRTLLREHVLEGYGVPLGDGALWLVPTAQRLVTEEGGGLVGECVLPVRPGLDARTGLWIPSEVVPEYAELWAMAERWWEQVVGAPEEVDGEEVVLRFDFDLKMELATRALGVNYRVGPVEVVMLGLLSEPHAVWVLNAVAGVPQWNRLVKKKLPAGSG